MVRAVVAIDGCVINEVEGILANRVEFKELDQPCFDSSGVSVVLTTEDMRRGVSS